MTRNPQLDAHGALRHLLSIEGLPRDVLVNILDTARAELTANLKKKTKSIVIGDAFNRVPISAWIGYDREAHGGIYVGNATSSYLWRFPEKIPRLWERAY